MIYLSIEQILFVHSRLIAETGGAHGVRDLGLLDSAVSRPQATFGSEDLYPDVFDKAAALMESIVQNHPFVDGNKRAGITAAGIFPRGNGYRLTATNQDLEECTMGVAEGKIDDSAISAWLKSFRQAG